MIVFFHNPVSWNISVWIPVKDGAEDSSPKLIVLWFIRGHVKIKLSWHKVQYVQMLLVLFLSKATELKQSCVWILKLTCDRSVTETQLKTFTLICSNHVLYSVLFLHKALIFLISGDLHLWKSTNRYVYLVYPNLIQQTSFLFFLLHCNGLTHRTVCVCDILQNNTFKFISIYI